MSNRSDAGSGNMAVGPEAATSPASAAPACRCHRWWNALLAGGISLLVGLRLLPLATRTAGGRRIHPAGKSGLDAVTLRRLETELALLRDVLQLRRAYRYTYFQCRRHGVCADPMKYPHTRVFLDVESAVSFAVDHHALLEKVPYARYEKWRVKKNPK